MVVIAFLVLLAGIHMMLQPRVYVGRGPIPAQSAGNVRAMGVLFTILGGATSAFALVPLLLFKI